ncbi:MAG: DUF1315 family protein [Ferrimonas sp.]
MDWQQMIDALTPELLERLRLGVETGRWPDGTRLTDKQRESAMQAIMYWEATHQDNQGHLTINRHGQINQLSKKEQQRQFRHDDPDQIEFNEQ